MSPNKPTPPGGWINFWNTAMTFEERMTWLRDSRPDDDLGGDILREEQQDERARAWEKERLGI